MHDEILVRVLNRVADRGKQCEALLDVERLPIAVGRNRLARHVLHREVGPAVGGDAAIEEARDVGMLQPRQNLPLAEKAPVNLTAEGPASHELQRNLLLELAVGTIGQEHAAHAAMADLPDQAVRSDAIARLVAFVSLDVRSGGVDQPRCVHHRGCFEELGRAGVGGDETLDLCAENRIAGAGALERFSARARLELQHFVQDCLDAGPFLGREGARHDGSLLAGLLDLLKQERARLPPLTLDLVGLSAQCFGGFFDREPREEPQFDDTREAFAEGLEARERGVERDQLARAFLVGHVDPVERDLVRAAAALLPRRPARMVDDDLAHRLGGDGKEVAPIRPVGAGAVDELQIRLMHEHGGVDRLARPGASELTTGGGAKFGVDEAEHEVDRVAVSLAN